GPCLKAPCICRSGGLGRFHPGRSGGEGCAGPPRPPMLLVPPRPAAGRTSPVVTVTGTAASAYDGRTARVRHAATAASHSALLTRDIHAHAYPGRRARRRAPCRPSRRLLGTDRAGEGRRIEQGRGGGRDRRTGGGRRTGRG